MPCNFQNGLLASSLTPSARRHSHNPAGHRDVLGAQSERRSGTSPNQNQKMDNDLIPNYNINEGSSIEIKGEGNTMFQITQYEKTVF